MREQALLHMRRQAAASQEAIKQTAAAKIQVACFCTLAQQLILPNAQCLTLIASIRSFLSASVIQEAEGRAMGSVFSLALHGVMVHVMVHLDQ